MMYRNQCTAKEKLMNRINEVSFAVNDVLLYLDTHPCCEEAMLIGIAPDTALGRIVSVRAEDRKEYLENFTPEQHRIRNEWKSKHAEFIKNHTTKEQMDAQLDAMKMAFMRMAGLGGA